MNITDYLSLNAEKYGDIEAVVCLETKDSISSRSSISWERLNVLANQVANYLISNGINKNDKVGMLIPNTIEWLPIYFGILICGAVVVPLNYFNSAEEISHCLKIADCKLVFVSEKLSEDILNIIRLKFLDNIKCCSIISSVDFFDKKDSIFLTQPFLKPDINIYSSDNAAIYFSSGTTGKSKAILLSHGSLMAAAETELSHHKQIQDDKFLCVSPLFHTGAIIHWFGSLLVGGAIVILKNIDPTNIVKTIKTETITIAWLPVPQIQDILDLLDISIKKIDKSGLASLRLMHSGAQQVPALLIKRWLEHFPNMLYDTSYGLTETTGPGCINLGLENIHKMGSIGKPDKFWSVRIVDEGGNEVPQGDKGEIILKGPGVMKEYYNDEDSTLEAKKGDWLYTGDIAYKDVDGFIYIVDRKKDVVISGGENIYPVQIEKFLRTNPHVRDVAVLGIKNYRLGEVVAAVIEIEKGCDCSKQEIYNFCEQLPQYQRPRKIVFGTLIRNSNGKIDKKALKNYFT